MKKIESKIDSHATSKVLRSSHHARYRGIAICCFLHSAYRIAMEAEGEARVTGEEREKVFSSEWEDVKTRYRP